ncbi:MAG TPA: pilin [Gammaproteobacteria bacterium]|nr:pilin [Gammaproteobacteria bacterium]
MTTSAGRQRAFSIPEFALVLAVTALIAGLGASAYKTFVVRAQVSQSLELAARAQRQVAQSYQRDGDPPADREAAGLSAAKNDDRGEYVDSIDIVNGRIDLHFGNAADAAIAGRTLSLTPFESASRDVFWVCGNRVAGVGLRPLGFANGARQSLQVVTPIEPRYLPSTCR